MALKARHIINFHKASTMPLVVGLMHYFDNFGIGPYVYLAIHGTYGILWLIKDCYFPDKSFDIQLTVLWNTITFVALLGYWAAPFLLIRGGYQPPPVTIAMAIFLYALGIFMHFCGDCQKYFTLRYRKGLIQEGLFSQSRNINYLGEILIYLSFNILANHWLPFVLQACFIVFIFYPSMRKKDRSLSRYEEFEKYQTKTWLLLPKLF